jgi:hypothetical protein
VADLSLVQRNDHGQETDTFRISQLYAFTR